MNIAIFNHYWTDFYTSKDRINSYGILNYLKEIIDKRHNCLVFDTVKNYKKEIELPEELFYLKRYLKEDITEYLFFNKYYQFGDKKNFNHKELINFKPDVILVSSFAFCYFNGFKESIIYIKKIVKDAIIIAGGSGASSNPIYYLENTPLDYVVIGPAEISLNKLLDNIEKGKDSEIENVISRKNIFSYKKDLNSIYYFSPFITKINDRRVSLQLTRGCPENCSYCSIKLIAGNKFLFSSIDDIKKSIDNLKVDNICHFCFEDDNITYKKEYFLEIVRYIKEKFKNSTFSLENGVYWKTIDLKYLKQLIKHGLNQLNLSLTSIDFNVLKNNKRDYSKEEFDEFLNLVENFSLPVIVYFICGLPFDTKDSILETLLYLASKKVIIGISPFYPVPNTEIEKVIKKALKPELCKGSSFYKWARIRTKSLITFFIISRFINAIKKINFFDIENLKEIFSKIKITDFKIEGNNLSRRELTIIGIIYSIKSKKIFAIKNEKKYYLLEEYICDKSILRKFFKKILNEIDIYTDYGKIEPKKWKDLCKILSQ